MTLVSFQRVAIDVSKARRKYPAGTPGGKGGQWMPTRGSGYTADAHGVWRDRKGNPAPAKHVERMKQIGVSRGYADVKLNPDDSHHLQALGLDAKGRRKAWYSPEFLAANAKNKFARNEEFDRAHPKITQAIDRTLRNPRADPAMREAALVLRLIDKTAFRPGSDKNTQAEKKAFGATTLQARHVRVSGDTLTFRFTGKKGVSIKKTLVDPLLARELGPRVKAGGRLFSTDGKQLKAFLTQQGYGKFMPKDFRTWNATALAETHVQRTPRPTSHAAYKKAQKRISTIVSQHLGNTPAMAFSSYINPRVWSHWDPAPKPRKKPR